MKELVQNTPLIIALAAIPVFIQATNYGILANIFVGMLLVGVGAWVSDLLKKRGEK